MILTFFNGFLQLVRFALNFGAPTKETRNTDEICGQFEVLQLDFSDTKVASVACIYLADPHKLPGPAKDANDNRDVDDDNASRKETNADGEISQQYFHCERTDRQDQLSEQYEIDDMSISSDSDFEEALQNHFQYTPRPKSGKGNVKNDGSCTSFASPLKQQNVNCTVLLSPAFTESFKSKESSWEGNFSLRNVTEDVNSKSNRSANSERRKRRINDNHFGGSSPVEQFCSSSFVASTPLSTRPDSERRRRLATLHSAVRTKVLQLKQRTLLNLSGGSTDLANTASSKDETTRREQGAIAKHIARIRASNSRHGSSLPSFSNTSYYSVRSSFGSNDSTSFS